MSVLARMNRLFAGDGKCFQLALDHALFNGYSLLSGVEDIGQVIDLAIRAGVDAVLLSPGQARRLQAERRGPKPALMMRGDVSNVYDPRKPSVGFSELLDEGLEQALRLDAAALLLNMFYVPDQPAVYHQCIRNIRVMKVQCQRYGMPLVVEPLVLEPDPATGGYQVVSTFETVVALHRQAVELGVDVIKADPTDRVHEYGKLVEVTKGTPLLPRGGGKVSDRDILSRTHQMLQAGAAGVVYGRNIFQHPNVLGMARAIRALIHEGADVETALTRL